MVDSILIEARPRLKSCNVSVKLSHSTDAKVLVFKNCLQVADQQFSFNNIVFDTQTANNLQSTAGYISFNVKMLDFVEKKARKWSLPPPVASNTPVSLKCVCSGVIAEKVTFKRVLPMPSHHWESADVFCHGHVAEKSQGFREDDCLYTTHFLQVSQDVVNVTQCKKCRVEFGQKRAGCVQIWSSCVQFVPSTTPKIDAFDAILHDVLFSPIVVFAKILLHTKQWFITITVIEKDLHVFQYTKQEEMNDIPVQFMLKVEFSYVKGENSVIKEWLKDTTVHAFEVPDILLENVKSRLQYAHEQLHPNFNEVDGRLLSYLPF